MNPPDERFTVTLPDTWTLEQALAIFELLNDVTDATALPELLRLLLLSHQATQWGKSAGVYPEKAWEFGGEIIRALTPTTHCSQRCFAEAPRHLAPSPP